LSRSVEPISRRSCRCYCTVCVEFAVIKALFMQCALHLHGKHAVSLSAAASTLDTVSNMCPVFTGLYEIRPYLQTLFFSEVDRLHGQVVRVPGCRTEVYCVSCEVRTEFICYVEDSRPPLWSSGQSSWLQNGGVLCFL
jgi:hypothetical protein